MLSAGVFVKFAFLGAVAVIWLMILYQAIMTAAGFLHRVRSHRLTGELLTRGGPLPPVSILVPARNEEVVIEDTLAALLALSYPGERPEIIVVDDGSTDRTAGIVAAVAGREPRVRLLRLPLADQGRGKSHALNAATATVAHGIVAVYDADNRPEPGSLEILVRRLLARPRIGAVLGKFRPYNRARNLLTAFVDLETLAFQWIVQAGRCAIFGIGILPGTNFVIRKEVLEATGGWDEQAITEDTELSIRIVEAGWQIDFAPEAVTWEEEPERFGAWLRQRTRWVRGNFYVLRKYLFRVGGFKNRYLALQVLSLSLLYYLFLGSVLVSHLVFLASVSGLLRVEVPGPYTLVWVVAFLLFIAEIALVNSYEGDHRPRQLGLAALMYLTYCQAWILVVFRALWHEYVLGAGSRWDKTVRYGTPRDPDRQPAAGKAGAAPSRRTLLLLVAGLSLLAAPAGADTLVEAIRGEEALLESHWGEVYGEGVFATREDGNLVGMLDLKDGVRVARFGAGELLAYVKIRAFKDVNGDYWNNKALIGPGLRYKPFPAYGLSLFAEYLSGTYYGIESTTPNPYAQTYSGLEAGAAFWQRWGRLPAKKSLSLPFTSWRELYFDAIYFQNDDGNFIVNVQGREGFGMMPAGPLFSDFYLRVNLAADANEDYWNNFAEGSVGVRVRPRRGTFDIKAALELVGGTYLDRGGRFENPDGGAYVGVRAEITFWYGWE